MIAKLDKEQSRNYRRMFLGDIVYVTFHDILKKWHQEGKTYFSPIEITLAANEFCKNILALPDIDEGLEEEMEETEEEIDHENDAMAVMMLATAMMQALGKQRKNLDTTRACKTIMTRWMNHQLLMPLLAEGCKKEEARWAQNKSNNLMEYELTDIESNEEGDAGIISLIQQLLSPTFGKTPETIKENLLLLNKYNIEHNHLYDKIILEVYRSLDAKPGMAVEGGNMGIMTGGNFNASVRFTDQQVKMIAKNMELSRNMIAAH